MKKTILSTLLLASAIGVQAQYPIIQTKYTADPAPYVHGDTIYLYTTHDEDDAEGFKMYDWLLYTSTDMVNWQDHGAVASLKDFEWYKGNNGAWAEQVIERKSVMTGHKINGGLRCAFAVKILRPGNPVVQFRRA